MGWGKAEPNLPSQEYALNPELRVRGWGKTGPAHSFPTLTRLNMNLVQKNIGWGKTVVHMVNCLRKKHSQSYTVMNTHATFAFKGWGKTGLAHSFPYLTRLNINLVRWLSGRGESLCIWLIVCGKKQPTLPCQGYTCILCFLEGGLGNIGPAHSFPILTMLNINLVQKVIGWGKTAVHMVNRVGNNSVNLTPSWIHM